jgi:hypothetical protein
MLTALLLSLSAQTPAPVLPAGLNTAYVSAVYSAESALCRGDFEDAAKAAKLLPHREVTYAWDTSGVPVARKTEFLEARNAALKTWGIVTLKLSFKESESPDILFKFVDVLPSEGTADIPAGARFDFSNEAHPRLTAYIALKRLSPSQPIEANDVQNEVAFAIGQYMGLQRTPAFGGFSTRTDLSTTMVVHGYPGELQLVQAALGVSQEIRDLVASRTKISPGEPKLELEKNKVEGLEGSQGEPLGFDVRVRNRGQGPLSLIVRPDCGCLAPQSPPSIAPGETGVIHAQVNTLEFVGNLNHSLLIYSNDPTNPLVRLPVSMKVAPLYTFVRGGPPVVQMGAKGGDAEVYLLLSKKAGFNILAVHADGPKVSATYEPWSGNILDPATDAQASPHSGYKFHIHMAPNGVPGRVPASLMVQTDDLNFPLLQTNVEFQKGIAALPQQIYLGEIDPQPRHMGFLLSKPQVDFAIKKVDVDSPFLTVEYKPTKGNWEYRFDVQYDGKASFGMFSATITVHTNDAAQPVIVVPVSGIIK